LTDIVRFGLPKWFYESFSGFIAEPSENLNVLEIREREKESYLRVGDVEINQIQIRF
jgi:hypothetical protein